MHQYNVSKSIKFVLQDLQFSSGTSYILSWIWSLRLATSESTWVPPECPVLRPQGTDNSEHRQVARQPQMPIDTANPGRVTQLRVIPYLWTAG